MQKGFSTLLGLLLILSIVGGGGYLYLNTFILKDDELIISSVEVEKDTKEIKEIKKIETPKVVLENKSEVSVTDSVDYAIFNSGDGWSAALPSSWVKVMDGSNLFVFPKGDQTSLIDDLYLQNNMGITIAVMSPPTLEKLEIFYSTMFKNLIIENILNPSHVVVEVKSGDIPNEPGSPVEGYIGKEYVIRTTKRIYSVNVFYRNSSDASIQITNLHKIVESLEENI